MISVRYRNCIPSLFAFTNDFLLTTFLFHLLTVPILIAVMKIANDKQILKGRINGKISNIIGWTTVMIMGISVVIMFATWG